MTDTSQHGSRVHDEAWTDHHGTRWERGHPRWLGETDVARLQLRSSTVVAAENPADPENLEYLAGAERKQYWVEHVQGHLDAANGIEPTPDADGWTYRASLWTDDHGRRLILITRWH